jgi:hypothetical protein
MFGHARGSHHWKIVENRRKMYVHVVLGALATLTLACSSDMKSGDRDGSMGAGAGASGGTQGNPSGGTTGTGGTGNGGSGNVGPVPPPEVETALPTLPAMSNVILHPGDHTVTVTFDPFDDAKDYRVYALPADSDVLLDSSDPPKLLGVQDAVYRCAGTHEAADIAKDSSLSPQYNNCEAFSVVDSSEPYEEHCGTGPNCYPTAGGLGNGFGEGGYSRKPDEIQLGYVYTVAGDGRAPVHAFLDTSRASFYDCSAHMWAAARNKRYSADPSEWATLAADGWFDMGTVFYVPETASDATQQVYTTNVPRDSVERHYYYLGGAEHDFRTGAGQEAGAAFLTLKAASAPDEHGAATALPLYRVLYSLGFAGHQHDELMVGKARFDAAYGQGQLQQNHSVTYSWSGDSPPEVLVVEALDQGCPFQGNIGEKSLAATDLFKQWYTFDEIQSSAPNGEMYLNGHYAGTTPSPIARSFVSLVSEARPAMDFMSKFGARPEVFSEVDIECGSENFGCDAGTLHVLESEDFDVTINGIDNERWNLFDMFGQLWLAYSDAGADIGAHFRMTAKPTATMAADSFLHVSMDMTGMSTARRYPQILIDDDMSNPTWITTRNGSGKVLILQPIGDWPTDFQVQICDSRPWAVNDQCPHFDMLRVSDERIAPNLEFGDQVSEDDLSRFEIYASTSRAYVFFNHKPFGCVDYDAGQVPNGEVKVTYGDVIYHTGVDEGYLSKLPNGFHHREKLTMGDRHLGNLGFSSGVAAPNWDEATYPCVSALQ